MKHPTKGIPSLVVAVVVVGTLIVPASLSAQDDLTIEELYLGTAVPVDILAAQIEGGGEELQWIALEAIADGLAAGILDPADDRLFFAIEPAVDRGVMTIDGELRSTVLRYGTQIREQAVRVLALLGTERAQTKLLMVAMHDPEPQLRIVALRGISDIGIDPNGDVSSQIARIIAREHHGHANPGTVYASILALEGIAGRAGNTFDPEAQAMLVAVASDHRYVQLVRQRAMFALSLL